MGNFFQELVRRNVLRVIAIYSIVGWLLRQLAIVMIPALGLPDVFMPVVTFLIFIGLPITLYLAWVYELTPEGLKKTPALPAPEEREKYTLNRLDYALVAGMAFVLAIIGLDTFAPPARNLQSAPAPSDATTVAGNQTASPSQTAVTTSQTSSPEASAAPANSIAVLPFTDLSSEMDQEYFSDGIAEEVLNALVKIRGMRVSARTSSFAFKGQEENPETIGNALNVAYILTGSVRKQNNRVRISVQLIDTQAGFQVWAESFNGSLEDIFDLQESISIRIAQELKVVLTGEDEVRLAKRPTDNQDAYANFLRGQKFVAARIGDNLPKAIDEFSAAVDKDPNFARAWSGLAVAHALSPQYRLVDLLEEEKLAEINARRALTIDPALAEPYAVLGWVNLQRRNYVEMRKQFEKALELEPRNATANLWYGIGLVAVGQLEDADRQFTRVKEIDPVSLVGLHMYSLLKYMLGETDEAEKYARRVFDLGFPSASIQLAEIAGEQGQMEEANTLFSTAVRGMATRFSGEERLTFARGIFGDPGDEQAALNLIEGYLASDAALTEQVVPYFLVRTGNTDLAFNVYAQNQVTFDPLIYFVLWGPNGKASRQDPAITGFAREIGLMDYWLQYGWPDQCPGSSAQQLTCR